MLHKNNIHNLEIKNFTKSFSLLTQGGGGGGI